ncbi:MAG TPA: cache domain-containing protein, partial [Candidatus Dormibacteraeota bacterium]|nr:cache domain-containing protein [Candidatus Dormibacteraeota bacterium]
MKIRTQIILPFLLLMVILGVVGTYLTTSLVATSLEERIGEQLVQSQNSSLDAAVKLQGRQVAGLRLIANTEGVDQAVRSTDVTALKQLLVPIEVNNRLGTVIVFDLHGRSMLEIDQPDSSNPSGLVFKSGTDLSQDAVVKPILDGSYDGLGDKYIGYEGNPVASLGAAGPILAGDRVVGGVLLQTPVPALLSEMKIKSQAQVILLDQAGRL